jgi:general secretion pathway protein I
MRPGSQSSRSAFTLIEVMIALSIFAMAAIVLGAAYVNVLTSYEVAARGTQDDEDFRFARQQLLAVAELKKVEDGDEFEGANGRKVRWTAEVTPTTMPDLFDVIFKCEISDSSKKRELTESFRLLRPTWSVAADRDKLRDDVRQRINDLNAQMGGSSISSSGTSSSSGTKSSGTSKGGGK